MQGYAVAALGGPRWQPLVGTITFTGDVDLTGADLLLEVRPFRNTPGAPLARLQRVTTAAAEGLRLISVARVAGKFVNTLGYRFNETTMEGMPFTGELGDSSVFAYDMQVTPAGGLKAKWLGGDFVVEGAVSGADNASTAPVPYGGYSSASRVAPVSDLAFQAGPIVISVTMAGGQGPRGFASGPLGAGSVGSEELVADPAEHAAMLSKLTYGGSSVADQLGASSAARDALARAVVPGTPEQIDALEFGTGIVGEMPPAIRINGGATAAIVAGGAASVLAPYNDTAKRALTAVEFAEGVLQFQVLRGADNGSSCFMLTILAPDGRARAVWSSDGTSLSYGYLDASGNPTALGNLAGSFIGGVNQLVWIELMTPPIYPGLTWYVRSWVDGGTRPTDDQAMKAAYPAGEPAKAAGGKVNQGRIGIASIGANPARIARLRSIDGRRGTKLLAKAALVGPWFSRFDGGRLLMATNNGSASMRMLVTGSNDLAIDYVATPDGGPVVLDAFVGGQRRGEPLTLDGAAGTARTKGWALGLDPAAVNQVEIVVRGVDVFSNMFYRGSGCLIEDVRASLASGRIAPWPDTAPVWGLLSDSIGAGAVARGTSSNPIEYGGDIAWHRQAARAAGFSPWIRALGGTGVTVPMDPAGGGSSPDATRHGSAYMEGRPIDGVALNLRGLTIHLGTNDASRGVVAATFKAGYKALVAQMLRMHPGLGRVLLMYPLNQAYAAQIFETPGELQDARVQVVDTSGWNEVTYTDTIHPNVAGHGAIAARMAPVYRTALAGALT